jgi:predicted 3-demethylubiquinone-9 3-methyltransferase (glyoxalase superfamily)
MNHPDKEKAKKVTEAMMKMKKIVIADLEAAAGA